jgi:hypothetical protein
MNNLGISQPPAQGKYYPSPPFLQCLRSRCGRGPRLHMNVVADLLGLSKSMIFAKLASDQTQVGAPWPATISSIKPQFDLPFIARLGRISSYRAAQVSVRSRTVIGPWAYAKPTMLDGCSRPGAVIRESILPSTKQPQEIKLPQTDALRQLR